MDLSAPQLPSKVAQTLAECPRFRILVVGKTGVGKSSLVSSIFNIDKKEIDIADGRAGTADIRRQYTSTRNERLVLHDSQGFEPGSPDNWKLVKAFLQERNSMELKDRIHAVWLCIKSPRKGDRVQQTGDEEVLKLAKSLGIPVIAVFTQCDRLLQEQLYLHRKEKTVNISDLEREAEVCFNERIKDFQKSTGASIVKVSTDLNYPKRLQTLNDLTKLTIRSLGGTVEEEVPDVSEDQEVSMSLDVGGASSSAPPEPREGQQQQSNVPESRLLVFVAAQQTDPTQKVEYSIREGFKKYWRNLAKSSFFQGHTLEQCVWRIHDDILRVWNFTDTEKILLNEAFFKRILKIAEPILKGHEAEVQDDQPSSDMLSNGVGTLTSLAASNPSAAPIIFGVGAGVGLGFLTLKFLFGAYKKMNLTAQYLVAYIVHLTCILHCILTESLKSVPPQELSEEFIAGIVDHYEKRDAFGVHQSIAGMTFYDGLEGKIRKLIYDNLGPAAVSSAVRSAKARMGDTAADEPDASQLLPSPQVQQVQETFGHSESSSNHQLAADAEAVKDSNVPPAERKKETVRNKASAWVHKHFSKG